jgi:hypothetical protein
MLHYSYQLEDGFITSLTDLRERLADISNGDHQWAAQVLPKPMGIGSGGDLRRYVIIGCTNAPFETPPNHLCFLFPILLDPVPSPDEETLLICLHAEVAIMLSHGLYFEGDKLKGDVLGDWLTFWSPLGQSLQTNPPLL